MVISKSFGCKNPKGQNLSFITIQEFRTYSEEELANKYLFHMNGNEVAYELCNMLNIIESRTFVMKSDINKIYNLSVICGDAEMFADIILNMKAIGVHTIRKLNDDISPLLFKSISLCSLPKRITLAGRLLQVLNIKEDKIHKILCWIELYLKRNPEMNKNRLFFIIDTITTMLDYGYCSAEFVIRILEIDKLLGIYQFPGLHNRVLHHIERFRLNADNLRKGI